MKTSIRIFFICICLAMMVAAYNDGLSFSGLSAVYYILVALAAIGIVVSILIERK
jgi:hypothetical protein